MENVLKIAKEANGRCSIDSLVEHDALKQID